ncbi:MAG: hypothetical protein E7170_00195 [Firmicutes bacterium]|nr:hypothetical protein [Bacillota bacterium]
MKFNNINMDKMKKITKKGLAVLAIGTVIGISIPGITKLQNKETTKVIPNKVYAMAELEKNKNEEVNESIIYNRAYAVIDAAKYEHLESLFTDEVITSGEVSELDVKGVQATNGTWETLDMDNDGTPEIILKDVEIDGYIINTDSEIDEYDLKIKRR